MDRQGKKRSSNYSCLQSVIGDEGRREHRRWRVSEMWLWPMTLFPAVARLLNFGHVPRETQRESDKERVSETER